MARGLRWLGRGVEAIVLSPREAERELANLKAMIETGDATTAHRRPRDAAANDSTEPPEHDMARSANW